MRVTFVFVRPGSNPSIKIKSPVDISDQVGEIDPKGYQKLKDRIKTLVEDTDCGLYFHNDPAHKYTFNESSLPNDGIYGMKVKRKDDSDQNTKLTASKLSPIQT